MRSALSRLSCAALVVASTPAWTLAQDDARAREEEHQTFRQWQMRCVVVTASELVCDISPLQDRGIAITLIGGLDIRGPDTRPIAFLSDLSATTVAVDGGTIYPSYGLPPKTSLLVHEMLVGHQVDVHPNTRYLLDLDRYQLSLEGFRAAYCGSLRYLKMHGSAMYAAPKQGEVPGLMDDTCQSRPTGE
jgi:hypothetical protein